MAKLTKLEHHLVLCLREYVKLYPAFRSKPVGELYSPARSEQNFAIDLENDARAVIDWAEGCKQLNLMGAE